jgi:autotransporter-associated beta strand protein
MNVAKHTVLKSRLFPVRQFLALILFALTVPAFAQLQWSSYDTSGNLVTANVATGGAANGGGSVTFTIPANTQLSFVTKNFIPFGLTGPNARRIVTFNVSASGGFGGVLQRTMGWGLYNSAGTAGFTDDVGYFGLWNGSANDIETYDHPSGTANLMSGTKLGQGTSATGTPADGSTYTNQILLVMNAAVTGISLGTSSSTLPNAGLAMNGLNGVNSVAHRVFTNPVIPLLGGANSFDEFVFMFNNTTGSPVTVTLSEISLVDSMVWDASGSNPTAPTDGAGSWSTTNANWSTKGSSDNVWLSGYNAIFGSGGAGATVTVTSAPTVVGNITLNTNYVIVGNPLTLTNTPAITVAGGTSATISSLLNGTSFHKEGTGTLVLNQTSANSYVGDTVINAGTLQDSGAGGVAIIAGNLIVNPNGTFASGVGSGGQGVFASSTAIINGGIVTNSASGGAFDASMVVMANNATFANGGSGVSATYAVTNTDARSGINNFTRHGFGVTNFIYKSTAGTATIGTRPNASATDGYVVTVNAGTLIFDKSIAANNANRLKVGSPLTFAGGRLQFNDTGGLAYTTENPSASGTFFNSGASSLYSTNNGTGGSITFGPLNRRPGATFNLVKQDGTGNIGSTVANVNGIVGGWNTYNLTDWTAGTTAWNALAAGSYTTSTDPTTWAAANNVSLNASTSPNVPDLKTINTLRLTAASTVTLGGSLTLTSGGLLVTGSGATAITGGTLLGAAGQDLIVHQIASADLTVSSTLADNVSATSLTKDGTGKLIITGINNMTGTNYLNGGAVEVSDLAKLASGPLDMNGGTLRYTGLDTTSTRAVVTRGLGPIFDVIGGTKLTQSAAITGSGDAIGDFGGLTKIGNGTLILSASNYFNGELVVSNGVLAVNGTNACNKSVWDAGKVTVYGGTLGGSGLISGFVTVKNGGTISPGNSIGTLTVATNVSLESGSTSLFELTNSAAGDLLVIQGNLAIASNSTLAISVLGSALEPSTNTVITYTGTKSGSFNPIVSVNGALDSSVSIDESTPGQIKVVATSGVAITTQPQDEIVSTNDPATFTVVATGSSPIGYQWYSYGNSTNNPPVLLNDQTNASFTIASAQSTDTGLYAVLVTNNNSSVLSRFASLIVGNVAPILNGPFNQTVIQGNNATFSTSVVIANPQPTFQWQTNGVDVTGATTTSLTLNNVQFALNNTTVSVIASNAAAMVTNSAILTVIVPPVITPQPTNITVNVGDTVTFWSGATGVPSPALQWYKNNTPIPLQTGAALTIANAQGSDIGSYKLVATNIAGAVTSSIVTLTVNSTTLAANAFSPANGATGVGYDTPLYVTFNGPVSVVNSGKIRIFNAATAALVDTIDMSSNTVVISSGIGITNNIQPHSLFSGDAQVINYFPVIITGNTAAIYPHGGVMTSNQTYYVTLDNGVVADSSGAYYGGMSDTNAWRFTTKPTGPANPTNLVVAADGSGDFVTVQGAVDSVAPGNNAYTLINIRDGNYVEIVNISGKNNISFRGQSREGTIVGYPNNNNLTGTTAGRMSFKVNSADIKLENLTILNATPQGGSQAEALLVYNAGLRCVVENCDIVSRQDTILINATASQAYLHDCLVIGNFDYIWGSGVGYFNHCVFHTITNILSGSYNLTAARSGTSTSLSTNTPWINPNGTTYSANGFTFVCCTLEADAGVAGITLAGNNGTAGGLDAWIHCKIDTNAYVSPSTTLSNTYVFWQYTNKDITCTVPVSFTNVQTIGITNNDPRLLAATNPVTWFYGWSPQLAPNILTNPVSQTIAGGATATFNVSATGVPDPSYQWLKNGTNLIGQSGSTLTISNADVSDAGTYSVIVSNIAGTVTSSTATLTVGNTGPVLAPIADQTVNVGVTVNITNVVTDPDVPPQSLTFTLLAGPTNATLDASSGVFTLRPLVSQADTTNAISIMVADNGTPSLSSTQSFNVIVNPLTAPTISAPSSAGGQFNLTVNGQTGPDYAVQVSTNLAQGNWTTIFTASSPSMPFTFGDTNTAAPMQFYRVIVGPPLP